MSTPIQHLPPSAAGGGAPPELPNDPEVMAVLSEIESEVNTARAAHAAATAPQVTAAAAPMQQMPTRTTMPMPPPGCHYDGSGGFYCGATGGAGWAAAGGLWNQTYAQYALIAGAVALALFYPASLEAIYQKIPVPRVSALLEQNDKIVRALLFAAIVYVVLMRVRI